MQAGSLVAAMKEAPELCLPRTKARGKARSAPARLQFPGDGAEACLEPLPGPQIRKRPGSCLSQDSGGSSVPPKSRNFLCPAAWLGREPSAESGLLRPASGMVRMERSLADTFQHLDSTLLSIKDASPAILFLTITTIST